LKTSTICLRTGHESIRLNKLIVQYRGKITTVQRLHKEKLGFTLQAPIASPLAINVKTVGRTFQREFDE
jgi:hypothetical protein